MSEENTNQQQAEVQTSAEIKVEDTGSQEIQSPEVVEVPWEKLQETFQMREALRETQNYTSEFILQTERRKRRLLAEIDSIERAM